jgi:hypothetical protein
LWWRWISNRTRTWHSSFLDLPRSRFNVCLTQDIVPLKYTPGLVPGELRSNHFGNAAVNHIPHSRAAEIVEQQPAPLHPFLAVLIPRLNKSPEAGSVA